MTDAPALDAPAPAGLTGLEQMRAIAAGATGWRGIGHLMGFRAVTVEEGRVVFAGAPEEWLTLEEKREAAAG